MESRMVARIKAVMLELGYGFHSLAISIEETVSHLNFQQFSELARKLHESNRNNDKLTCKWILINLPTFHFTSFWLKGY